MKRSCIAYLIVVFLALDSLAQSDPAPPPRALAITHVTIIDVNGGPAKTDMTVVVLDGRIRTIGKSKAMRTSENVRTVDASGKFLIPGLWDMNVYLDTDDSEKNSRLPGLVANGITAVRVKNGGPQLQQWNKDVESGKLLGPTMFIDGSVTGEMASVKKPQHNLHEELRKLVASGSTPLEALQSATVTPAKFFNKLDSMGSISTWKQADMILLDANPLDDIGNTTKINAVVIRGKLLDRQQLNAMLNEVKAAEQAKSELHQ